VQDEEDADELENDLFANKLDVSALLERMGDQETGTNAPAALQPYEILAKTARRARASNPKPAQGRAGPSREPNYGNSSEEVSPNLDPPPPSPSQLTHTYPRTAESVLFKKWYWCGDESNISAPQ
jgi:hypothetical protein